MGTPGGVHRIRYSITLVKDMHGGTSALRPPFSGRALRRPLAGPASRLASYPGFALLTLCVRIRARSALPRPPPGIAPARSSSALEVP